MGWRRRATDVLLATALTATLIVAALAAPASAADRHVRPYDPAAGGGTWTQALSEYLDDVGDEIDGVVSSADPFIEWITGPPGIEEFDTGDPPDSTDLINASNALAGALVDYLTVDLVESLPDGPPPTTKVDSAASDFSIELGNFAAKLEAYLTEDVPMAAGPLTDVGWLDSAPDPTQFSPDPPPTGALTISAEGLATAVAGYVANDLPSSTPGEPPPTTAVDAAVSTFSTELGNFVSAVEDYLTVVLPGKVAPFADTGWLSGVPGPGDPGTAPPTTELEGATQALAGALVDYLTVDLVESLPDGPPPTTAVDKATADFTTALSRFSTDAQAYLTGELPGTAEPATDWLGAAVTPSPEPDLDTLLGVPTPEQPTGNSLAMPGSSCAADPEDPDSLQVAVNGANNGDTVRVCPGYYPAALTINKANLTLVSTAGAGNTFIGPVTISASGVSIGGAACSGFTVAPLNLPASAPAGIDVTSGSGGGAICGNTITGWPTDVRDQSSGGIYAFDRRNLWYGNTCATANPQDAPSTQLPQIVTPGANDPANPASFAPTLTAPTQQYIRKRVRNGLCDLEGPVPPPPAITVHDTGSTDPPTAGQAATVVFGGGALGRVRLDSATGYSGECATEASITFAAGGSQKVWVQGCNVSGTRGHEANRTVTVNRAPTASLPGGDAVTPEDTAVDIQLAGADLDGGDLLSYQISDNPGHGSVAIASGASVARYTPASNYNGSDSFGFQARDNKGGVSEEVQVEVEITPRPDGPTAAAVEAQTPEEEAVTITLGGDDPDLDMPSDQLSYSISAPPENGTLGEITQPGPDQTEGTVTYTSELDFDATDSFTYEVRDQAGAVASAKVEVEVSGVNDAPTAADLTLAVLPNISGDLELSGADVDGDKLRFSVATQPEHGVVAISGSKASYSPYIGYQGPDSFTYRASDGHLSSAAAKVTVAVGAVATASRSEPVVEEEAPVEESSPTVDLGGGEPAAALRQAIAAGARGVTVSVGGRARALRPGESIPNGAIVDATRGKLTIVTALDEDGSGIQRVAVSRGVFRFERDVDRYGGVVLIFQLTDAASARVAHASANRRASRTRRELLLSGRCLCELIGRDVFVSSNGGAVRLLAVQAGSRTIVKVKRGRAYVLDRARTLLRNLPVPERRARRQGISRTRLVIGRAPAP